MNRVAWTKISCGSKQTDGLTDVLSEAAGRREQRVDEHAADQGPHAAVSVCNDIEGQAAGCRSEQCDGPEDPGRLFADPKIQYQRSQDERIKPPVKGVQQPAGRGRSQSATCFGGSLTPPIKMARP